MKSNSVPIVIIHFNPLERYPPIINLLNYLADNCKKKIIVLSTRNGDTSVLKTFKSRTENITVKRVPGIKPNSIFRIFNYLFFYAYCFYSLVKYKPKSVLYFETISAWPGLLYKKFRRNRIKLLVHYHEYNTPLEYQNGMRLVKAMHKMEKKMYPFAFDWISQTNNIRLIKFKEDNQLENVDKSVFHVMPNYPSKYWSKGKADFNSAEKIRLVYVGSIGYDSMYLKEVTDWVLLNKEKVSLDFYTDNIDDSASVFLHSIKDNAIKFHGGCEYEDLPLKLINYDVGLVIYKPVSENWIHNAPNKIFEYLACGLDVWFSRTMSYTLSMIEEQAYPKVLAVDFENIKEFNIDHAVIREGLKYKEYEYFYEDVYGEIYEVLNSK